MVGILRTLLTTLLFKAIIDGIPLVSQTLLGRAITLPNMARLFQPFKPIIEACGKKFSLCKSLPKLLPKLPCVIGVLSVGAASYGLVAGAEFNWEVAGSVAVDIADTIGDCRSRGLGGGSDGPNPRGDGPNVCNSFPAGTRVLLADGTSRPIEQIRVGDRVLATDPETGATTARAVTHLITGEGEKHLVELSLATDGGTRTLVATAGHPFWSVERGAWVDAGELQAGELVQEADGTYVRVLRTDLRMTVARVHNLTVEVDHTYYVLAGDDPVLVHNANVCTSRNYRDEFNDHLEAQGRQPLDSRYHAHHSLPQEYESLFASEGVNIHDVEFIRGVPSGTHWSEVARYWNEFRRTNPNPTTSDVSSAADKADALFANVFVFP